MTEIWRLTMNDTGSTTLERPEPAESPLAMPGGMGAWFAGAAAMGLASSILVRAFSMPWGLRFAVALLPLPALIGLALSARKLARHLDELERRVQLEAMATAFGVAGVAFLLYTQLQIAGLLGPEDWFMPWLTIWTGYTLGLGSARRRFQ
jgi:hypothetical protein